MRIARLALALALVLGAASPVPAQDVPPGLEGLFDRLLRAQDRHTVLDLSETVRREVPDDEIVATLVARAQAQEPGPAQNEVNRRMAAALDKARAVEGVRVTSGGYHVYREQPSENVWVWVAVQELNLESADGERLLTLVGELQSAGLAVQDLRWQLADTSRRAIERSLLSEALQALEAKARTAADALSLTMSGWRRVSLAPDAQPMPRFRAPMAMAAADEAAPPVAAAGTSEVTVTVSAEALLARP